MATFTSAQLLSLMETILGSGLTVKQLNKKISKATEILSKQDPDFDKIVGLFINSSTDTRLKRPLNCWQLFLSDHRSGLEHGMSGKEQAQSASSVWAQMDDDDKIPYIEQAAKLSTEYKHQQKAIEEAEAKSRALAIEAAIVESWGDLDELEWTRYGHGDVYWEFFIKDNQYLIREGDGKKYKLLTREMMTKEAIQTSIAAQIRMHELIGYTLI